MTHLRCSLAGPALLLALFISSLTRAEAQSPSFRRCPTFAEAVAGAPAATEALLPWRCLELELQAPSLQSLSGLDPYRDLDLTITLRKAGATAGAITGFGFWDGGGTFRFRTTLPPPEGQRASQAWSWSTGCVRRSDGKPCAENLGLQVSGSVTLAAEPAKGDAPDLYRRGFLRASGEGAARKPYLTYADGTPFFWLGDTAWEGPVKEAQTPAAAGWLVFLDDRRQKGFSVVQVAPAPSYGDDPLRGFSVAGDCTDPVPNACSTPDFAYWRRFAALVEEANRRGLVVAVLGMIDPLDRGGGTEASPDKDNPYPAQGEALRFAGTLAARLAGNHVVFSPGYDDKPAALNVEEKPVSAVMDAVGAEVRRVAPRHLIGNHLAGGAQREDYEAFESSRWLSFHLFHSGHAMKVGNGCPSHANLTRHQCSVKRARELPEAFRGRKVPSVNGEGGYDFPATPDSPPPDNRYGTRHTAYVSLLSGAAGFTFGSDGIYNWKEPGRVLDSPGAGDMATLGRIFRSVPWQELAPVPGWIRGNPPPDRHGAEERRMFLAGTEDGSVLLAYLPDNDAIEIDTTRLRRFRCPPAAGGSAWSIRWYAAGDGQAPPVDGGGARCAAGDRSVVLKRPPCEGTSGASRGGCDWVVELRQAPGKRSAPPAANRACP